MLPEKIKHLELIQNVISRMNSNSFQIKIWSIIVVSILLAIYTATKNNYFFLVGIFPIVIFWLLDAYYLNQERKYRGLYNDVADVNDEPKEIKLFTMNTDLYVDGEYSYWSSLSSVKILKIYMAMIFILIAFFVYFKPYRAKSLF